jgi:DNA primase
LLKRFTRKVTVSFDGDQAGQKALRRSLELFLGQDMEARLLIFPPDQDPDSFVKSRGAENLRALVDRAYPLVDYYIDEVMGKTGSFQDIREVTREAMQVMTAIENPLEKDIFIRRVAERLSLNPEAIRREIKRLAPDRVNQKQEAPGARETVLPGDQGGELEILKIMVEHPEKAREACERGVLAFFANEEFKTIGEKIAHLPLLPGGKPDMAGLMELLEDSPWKKAILSRVLETGACEEGEVDRVMSSLAARVRQQWYRRQSQALSRELLKAEARRDQDECRRLLEEKNKLLARVKNLS